MWLLSRVGPHVCLEVIRPREFTLTDFTLERSDTSVFSAVPSQLVGPRKPLSAALVVADVRFLTSVLPDVHLEMRELQVAFGAAGVEADERLSLFFGFGGVCLLANQCTGLLVHGLSDLWDYEGGIRGHGHLERAHSIEIVRIGRNADVAGSRDLEWLSMLHHGRQTLANGNTVIGESGAGSGGSNWEGSNRGKRCIVLERNGSSGVHA